MPPHPESPLTTLAALGFGPETSLMRDPKLFVDDRFLGALIVELDDELGAEDAGRALFQIGLLHGLRDAHRAADSLFNPTSSELPVSEATRPTPLAIQFSTGKPTLPAASISIRGEWPERYEASARLAKLGPEDSFACSLSAGYTSGWLSGTMEADLIAVETECGACGGEHCRFEAREIEVWQAAADRGEPAPVISELLSGLPFATFREMAEATALDERASLANAMIETHGEFDGDAPVVHVWGPVMVLPFTSPDDALRTMDLLSRDPGTAEVRSVVIDLRSSLLDETFGAAALEQVLETIGLWGAEALLTGVSTLSEPVVASLETRHLLVRKDLPEAIAAAFQIAEAQRYTL